MLILLSGGILGTIFICLKMLLVSGDVKSHLELKRTDRLGEVARLIDRCVSSIQANVQGRGDTEYQVHRVANEARPSIANISQSAQVQSDATSSAAVGIEEIAVSISEVAVHAASTRDPAKLAAGVSANSAEISAQARATILAVASTVNEVAAQVELLGQRSGEVSRITGGIKQIAGQTNLLTLNAAIEAARADDSGGGLTVVADDARRLAERTAPPMRETSTMINTVRAETSKAAYGMRSGAKQVEDGEYWFSVPRIR